MSDAPFRFMLAIDAADYADAPKTGRFHSGDNLSVGTATAALKGCATVNGGGAARWAADVFFVASRLRGHSCR
jgi:hypothetical protein